MARKKIKPVNRITLRAYISYKYESIKAFAEENNFKPQTIRKFLSGDNSLTKVNEEIVKMLLSDNIDPYANPLPKLEDGDKNRMVKLIFG